MPAEPRTRLIVIVGPTGAGKTRLALRIAEALGGEILSCDSQQVYRGMDIGTGKATAAERARVPHHLLDVLAPDEEMTAGRYVEAADPLLAAIAARGRPAIVCGGTGLYERALLLGLFDGPPASPALRAALDARAATEGVAALHAELGRIDPVSAGRIDPRDQKRLVRALEVFQLTGEPLSAHQARHDFRAVAPRYESRVLGLAPPRAALYRAIDARVEGMFRAGLLDEVAALRAAGYRPPLRSQQAIGYAQAHAVLEGTLDLARAVELVQRDSRRYARRQLSWYRADARVAWHADGDAVDLAALGRYVTGG